MAFIKVQIPYHFYSRKSAKQTANHLIYCETISTAKKAQISKSAQIISLV